jgi:hypothetical protein
MRLSIAGSLDDRLLALKEPVGDCGELGHTGNQ